MAAELALCHVCRELATISSRPSERIERAVDKAYANGIKPTEYGIKPTEFGGRNGTADIARAMLAAL